MQRSWHEKWCQMSSNASATWLCHSSHSCRGRIWAPRTLHFSFCITSALDMISPELVPYLENQFFITQWLQFMSCIILNSLSYITRAMTMIHWNFMRFIGTRPSQHSDFNPFCILYCTKFSILLCMQVVNCPVPHNRYLGLTQDREHTAFHNTLFILIWSCLYSFS